VKTSQGSVRFIKFDKLIASNLRCTRKSSKNVSLNFNTLVMIKIVGSILYRN